MRFKNQLLLMLGVALLPLHVTADVCVWRNPERTMQKLFPDARDYKTVTIKLTQQHVAGIEAAFGGQLEKEETKEFNFYEITGDKAQRLGVVMALAGKGEYGAIETVIGLNPTGRIVNVYIQRSRERANKLLRSERFLSQFIGKGDGSPLPTDKDVVGIGEAEIPVQAVSETLKKMLAFYEVVYSAAERKEK